MTAGATHFAKFWKPGRSWFTRVQVKGLNGATGTAQISEDGEHWREVNSSRLSSFEPVDPSRDTRGSARVKTREYVRNYNRGWKSTNLEFSDDIADDAEREAWLDGYMDAATGREKWHLLNCPAHHNGPGGCGAA